MKAWFYPLLFTLYALPLQAAPQVILTTSTVTPGDTLRVEVDGLPPTEKKLKVVLLGKSYPFFPVGPNALRALIGIPLGTSPQDAHLAFYRAGAPKVAIAGLEPVPVVIAGKEYPVENVQLGETKTPLISSEHLESKKIHQADMRLTARQFWEGSFVVPIPGPEIAPFGVKRTRNKTIDAGFHKGVDLRGAAGTPIQAANAGTVLLASSFKAHGRTVLINHGQGVMSIYLHMQSFAVKPGDSVAKGQVIGKVGASGLATGPHLHWQVYVHGVPVDPKQWLEQEL